jgi:pantoate--beta-alanine ligase
MFLYKKTSSLKQALLKAKQEEKTIGFVPTMGALHQGHLSLINNSLKENDITVVSIFVNPAQFNNPADFEKYPVTIENDIKLLALSGGNILFLPAVPEIYPNGYRQLKHFPLGDIETIFEGKYRPGHFQGVCNVMHRLLDIVQPQRLYMGQKDYQQCMVVNKLIELMNAPVQLITIPTLREPDGLAMSSRNLRLDPTARINATAVSKALIYIKENIQPGPPDNLLKQATAILLEKDFIIDYIAIADAATLQPVINWNGRQPLVALAAAFQKEVRLIDNMLLNPAYR